MQYLAMVSGFAADMDCIKEQLLQSNFVLEGKLKTYSKRILFPNLNVYSQTCLSRKPVYVDFFQYFQ